MPPAARPKIGKVKAEAASRSSTPTASRASTPKGERVGAGSGGGSSGEKAKPKRKQAKEQPTPAPAEAEDPFSGVPLEEGMEGFPALPEMQRLQPGEVRAYVVEEARRELKPSEALHKQLHVLQAEHARAGQSMKIDRTTLDLQLGAMLVKKNSSPKELVVAWDRKLKGCINKLDFCQVCIRHMQPHSLLAHLITLGPVHGHASSISTIHNTYTIPSWYALFLLSHL